MRYTEKAVKTFLNTGFKFPRRVVWAMGLIKYSAARANVELGLLKKNLGMAIAEAALELAKGLHDDKIVVDVFQTGSATGLNMNVNEVLAIRASEICKCEVHPNDHVNLCQSTNDIVPSAIRVSALAEVRDNLIPTLKEFIKTLDELSLKTEGVVKPGRTHLRDALPVTMGLEFKAFSEAFKHDLSLINNVLLHVRELPIGGTAVGTGFNSHPEFSKLVINYLREFTGLDLILSESRSRGMRLLSDLVALSSCLRVLAIDIYRLCQDLRLMYSGPATGLNEVDIPQEVPGSSIMPGKENPVVIEASTLAATQIIGLDHSNSLANMLGEFELCMGIPLIAYNIHTQIKLLVESMNKLSTYVLTRLKPNIERLRKLAEGSYALVTVLAPLIGYEKASELVKYLKEGKDLRTILKDLGFKEEEIHELVDINKMLKPWIPLRKLT